MTKFLPFLYDDNGFLTNQKCFIITGKHIEYLTVFLNSNLFKLCFRDSFPELLGGTRELSKIFFEQISILQIDDPTNNLAQQYVAEIQELFKEKKDTTQIEKKLNVFIYDLYNLNFQEIEYIEKSSH